MTCNCDVGMCTHRPDCRQLVPLEFTRAVYEGKAVARDPTPKRSKGDQIARLRKRLEQAYELQRLRDVVKGVLDLLEDEL